MRIPPRPPFADSPRGSGSAAMRIRRMRHPLLSGGHPVFTNERSRAHQKQKCFDVGDIELAFPSMSKEGWMSDDFRQKLATFAARAVDLALRCANEESTKLFLILPFPAPTRL